jgi:hypothetical protein
MLRHRLWLVGMSLYALAAAADSGYHLHDGFTSGDGEVEFSEFAVAYSAGLFWPLDLIAMALLGR